MMLPYSGYDLADAEVGLRPSQSTNSESHQPTAPAASRHQSFATEGFAEPYRPFVVPEIHDGIFFDIANGIVMVVAAEAHAAVTV